MQVAPARVERNAVAALQSLQRFLWDSALPAGSRSAEELGSFTGSSVPAWLLFGSTSSSCWDALGRGLRASRCAHPPRLRSCLSPLEFQALSSQFVDPWCLVELTLEKGEER